MAKWIDTITPSDETATAGGITVNRRTYDDYCQVAHGGFVRASFRADSLRVAKVRAKSAVREYLTAALREIKEIEP